jgi:hypothetical protein
MVPGPVVNTAYAGTIGGGGGAAGSGKGDYFAEPMYDPGLSFTSSR